MIEAERRAPGFRLRRFRNWFFVGLLYAGYYLCRYNLGIVAPELKEEYGFSNQDYGWINSARDGGYAVGQFINGLLADGLGGKQSMAAGAILTIVLNLAFWQTSFSSIAWILTAFIILRLFDGYSQAFGAPGMLKINAAWFERRERGWFSGVFGGMIQLGAIGVGQLGALLLVGFTIPLVGIAVHALDWRSMFIVPPAILGVILVLAWFNIKNHPEQAGYRIKHDDDDHESAAPDQQKLPLRVVFRRIAGNPLAWINAGAYFCTGFVRRALEAWWVLYLLKVWDADKTSSYYHALVFALPISAFVGSFGAGVVSDLFFRGRRSPVAAVLYGVETVAILAAMIALSGNAAATPWLACVLLTVISLTCNSSHSIIGAAAVMDLGGRRMAGFACGVIDSFQYFGAILAGFLLGGLIDKYGWSALFASMLPFSLFGALLMTLLWWNTRGRDVRGA